MTNPSIAVDVMGGDAGPSATLPAIRLFLEKNLAYKIHAFGPISLLEPWIDCLPPSLRKRIVLFHAPEVVDNHLSSKEAIRRKNSSMRLAIESVKIGTSGAIVSGGHTGALMALSKILLSTLPHITRPAIAKALPCLKEGQVSPVVMLDLGANLECDSQNLFEFAFLGDALFRSIQPHHSKPVIKILNIGTEDKKGHTYLQEVGRFLTHSHLNYQGFIEPSQIFIGAADVVVTDGFTGNIALKTAEGVVTLIKDRLKNAFLSNIQSRVGAFLVKDSVQKHFQDVDPVHHNGGCILGLNGIVIKSHGNAPTLGFLRALEFAAAQMDSLMIEKVKKSLARFPGEENVSLESAEFH